MLQQQQALTDLALQALSGDDIPGLLTESAAIAGRLLAADLSGIFELAPSGRTLVLRAGTGWDGGPDTSATLSAGPGSLGALALASPAPLVVPDLNADRRFAAPSLLRQHAVVSGVYAVIPGGPRPYGLLSVSSRRPRSFSEGEIPFLEALARLLGAALDREGRDQDMRRRERELTDFVENAAIGLHWVGRDGRILWANQAELDLLGYRREEYVGHHIAEFHANPSQIQDILQRLLRDETLLDYEAQLRCKDGSIRDVLINSNVLWENGSFIHTRCFTRDITELKRAEAERLELLQREQAARRQAEAAEQRNALLAAIVESSEDAILSKSLDGTILSWNAAAERLYGYRAEEAIGRSVTLLIPPDLPDEFPSIMARLQRGEQIEHYETERVRKDGQRVHVSVSISPIKDASGVVTGAAAIARDITERRRMEEERVRLLERERLALHESQVQQRRLLGVLEQIPVGVVIVNAPEGRLALWNAAAERLDTVFPLLPSPEGGLEALRDRRYLFADGADYPWEELPLVRALRGDTLLAAEMAYEQADGQRITLLVNAAPLYDEAQQIIAAVAVYQDITQRKTLEQLKDEFLSLAAHELKTPLTAIKGYGQMLLRRLDRGHTSLPPQEARAIRAVAERAGYMESLINELLDLSRIETGRLALHPDPMDLVALLNDVIEQQRQLHQGYTFTLATPVAQAPGVWDRGRLEQVFTNLLDNAAKYSPEGSPVEVHLDPGDRQFQVAVHDRGIGIPAGDLSHIFERHFRAGNVDRSSSGLGLGLYLSHQIVQRHGGRIWVESQPGHGSTFYVMLPRS